MTLKKETRDKLLNISTATLFTAMFKRGLRNQCLQGVHPVHADLTRKTPNMVGEAYTLRYIPALNDGAAHVRLLSLLVAAHAGQHP